MTIQKANTIKFFRYLAIFCAITMGFFSIVATSEDDAADVLGIDDEFSTTADVELQELTVTKNAQAGAFTDYKNSGTTSIQAALDANNIDIPSEVDLTSVTLNVMDIKYKNTTWKPDTMDSISCDLTINEEGDTYYAIFSGILINESPSGTESITLNTDQLNVWNHYINPDNWDEEFDYILTCDDDAGAITEFSITTNVKLGITINGDYF